MSGVLNGVKNARGMPAISAARSIIYRPDSGLPFQLFFDILNKDIYVDQENGWELFTSGPGKYTFGSGLTNTANTITNNLTTGKSAGNIIFGFDDDLIGVGLELWSANTAGINSNFIRFGSWNGNNTAYFSNTGAWNFGAETDPTLTTPYQYVFQSRGVFNAQWDFNAAIKLLNTTGSHIQSVWQTNAPTGNANQTHLFFDSVGSPSFRIGTNNWFKLEPTTLTTNRTYTLQNADYTLAGTNVAQTFTALQTFNSGATFNAPINGSAGSAAAPSINFGTSNVGIYSDGLIRFAFSASNPISFASTGTITTLGTANFVFDARSRISSSSNGNINFANFAQNDFTSLTFQTGGATVIGIYNGNGSPETVVTARIGSLFLRRDGGANTTLYVKESGTGNTGWVAK